MSSSPSPNPCTVVLTRTLRALGMPHDGDDGGDDGVGEGEILVPFLMSLGAGLATTIGGTVVFFVDPQRGVPPALMAFVLALAAGVMLSVSVLELILPSLAHENGARAPRTAGFIALGCVAAGLLGRLVPHDEHDHHDSRASDYGDDTGVALVGLWDGAHDGASGGASSDGGGRGAAHALHDARRRAPRDDGESAASFGEFSDGDSEDARLRQSQWRLGLLMMLALTAHNLPEGVAVAVSASASRRSGGVVAAAIALHNIPEGLAIAVRRRRPNHTRAKRFASHNDDAAPPDDENALSRGEGADLRCDAIAPPRAAHDARVGPLGAARRAGRPRAAAPVPDRVRRRGRRGRRRGRHVLARARRAAA